MSNENSIGLTDAEIRLAVAALSYAKDYCPVEVLDLEERVTEADFERVISKLQSALPVSD